jgi:S1-C subfamily serine protease
MKRTLNLFFVISIIIGIMSCNPQGYQQRGHLLKPFGSLTKQQIIDQKFKNKSLDIIEGIWVWDNNEYEIALIKNDTRYYPTYNYIGVITESLNANWQLGEVKILLKKTVSKYIYSAVYFMYDKSNVGTTVTMPNENMMEMYLPTGLYGSKQKSILIRSYPSKASKVINKNVQKIITGTGFFISKKIIATNYHVVANAKKINLIFNSKKSNARLLIKDAINDLALLKVDFQGDQLEKNLFYEQIIPLPFGKVNLVKNGEKVFTIGFPLTQELGKEPRISEGIINSTVGINDDPRMYQISIPVQPGNSGSPLFNENGEVIGIITSTINNAYLILQKGTFPQNVNFAVKINYLNNLLELLPENMEPIKLRTKPFRSISSYFDIYKKSIVLIKSIQ